MVRRSLGVALWIVAGLLACFLGALAALVDTSAGRALLTRVTERALGRVFTGTVQVGDVSGSLLTGLTLSRVRLLDADTTLVAWLPRADLSYNPLDFAAGRVVFFEFALHQPVINIVQHRSGRLDIEELLRLGESRPDTGPSGPPTLILFRNVRIDDGTVFLRLQAGHPSPGDSGLEIQTDDVNGRLRVRRFEHLNAHLAALQVSSPAERGIRIDVNRLAVVSSDPRVRLVDVAGRFRVLGDSLDVSAQRVALPASALRDARGVVSWPHDSPLLYNLRLHADSATLRDVAFVDARLDGVPGAGVVTGDVRLRSHGPRLLEIELDPLRLAYAGGVVTGRLNAFSAADSGLVAVRDAELDARDFDLEFPRAFLDTLPFAGWLSGRTVADGPFDALALQVDWTFRDSLVTGTPESRVRGTGQVGLRTPDGIRFQPFTVEASSVDLGTVRRLAPAVALHGVLSAAGTLTGPLHDAQLAGTLEQRDGGRPPSRVTGTMRLDTRTDTLGIFADVTADSVSFDGLKGSFPDLSLTGAAAGPVRLAGALHALETHAALSGPGGTVTADGTLRLTLPRWGARDLVVTTRDWNLARWLPGAPTSRLDLTVRGTLAADSASPPVGALRATLGPSVLSGSPLDSGTAVLRFADRRVYVDTARVSQPGMISTAAGSLGWSEGVRGKLALDFDADSLTALDALVTWLVGGGQPAPQVADATADPEDGALSGSARALVTLDGSLDGFGLDARVSAERLHWRSWTLTSGRVRLGWSPGPVRTVQLDATLDSVSHGLLGIGGALASARGTLDSLTWFTRARLGDGAAFLAGGRFARRADPDSGAMQRVGIDSLAIRLPSDVWVLARPVTLAFSDSSVAVTHGELASAYGPGRLVLEGELPVRGRADAHLQVEAFPLAGLYALLEQDTSGVGGTLSATAALTGTRLAPVSNGAFSLTNGSFGEFRTPFVDGSFEYRDRRMQATVHLWRSGQQVLDVHAYLPLDLALAPVAQRELPDTLSVRATADSVDLSVLEALTPAVRQVAGVFSADVGVAGTWDAPRLRGALTITRAAATIPALNVRYEDVNGRLTLSGDTIQIAALSGQSDRGRADVAGVVRLERLTHPVLDLSIAADEFKALDLKNNVTVTASGRLALRGPVFGATLTGHAKVTSGVLYFADLVQKRIVNLDEFADTSLASLIEQQRLGPEFQNVFLDSLRIDELELEMGSDVWLRSDEANIQLAGTVTLSKLRDAYLMSGTLQAPRGTYRLKVGPVTREFLVTQGTVRYFGTPDQDAALDIEAKHTVHPVPTAAVRNPPDITVVAHITGTLLVPKVSLEAEKGEMSQTELISYLLFGKSDVDLAGDQGGIADQRALVQSALSVLSGEIEQEIVSGGVPVDYVEIRPSGGGQGTPLAGWQLAVGRQLGPKTFLVVNAGFCQGRPVAVSNTVGLSLQFRISPEWRTEASFEPVLTCADASSFGITGTTVPRQVGLDLFWEKRY